jgi:hypothetical protein
VVFAAAGRCRQVNDGVNSIECGNQVAVRSKVSPEDLDGGWPCRLAGRRPNDRPNAVAAFQKALYNLAAQKTAGSRNKQFHK